MVSNGFAKELEICLFPIKLFKLAHSKEVKSIFWSSDGLTVKLDTEKLSKECFRPEIFNVADHKHVFRQLSYYGFRRIEKKSSIWEFGHPLFRSDDKVSVQYIKRKGKKNKTFVKADVKDFLPERRKSLRVKKKEKEEKFSYYWEGATCSDESSLQSLDESQRKQSISKGRKRKSENETKSRKRPRRSAQKRSISPKRSVSGKDFSLLKYSMEVDVESKLRRRVRSCSKSKQEPEVLKETKRKPRKAKGRRKKLRRSENHISLKVKEMDIGDYNNSTIEPRLEQKTRYPINGLNTDIIFPNHLNNTQNHNSSSCRNECRSQIVQNLNERIDQVAKKPHKDMDHPITTGCIDNDSAMHAPYVCENINSVRNEDHSYSATSKEVIEEDYNNPTAASGLEQKPRYTNDDLDSDFIFKNHSNETQISNSSYGKKSNPQTVNHLKERTDHQKTEEAFVNSRQSIVNANLHNPSTNARQKSVCKKRNEDPSYHATLKIKHVNIVDYDSPTEAELESSYHNNKLNGKFIDTKHTNNSHSMKSPHNGNKYNALIAQNTTERIDDQGTEQPCRETRKPCVSEYNPNLTTTNTSETHNWFVKDLLTSSEANPPEEKCPVQLKIKREKFSEGSCPNINRHFVLNKNYNWKPLQKNPIQNECERNLSNEEKNPNIPEVKHENQCSGVYQENKHCSQNYISQDVFCTVNADTSGCNKHEHNQTNQALINNNQSNLAVNECRRSLGIHTGNKVTAFAAEHTSLMPVKKKRSNLSKKGRKNTKRGSSSGHNSHKNIAYMAQPTFIKKIIENQTNGGNCNDSDASVAFENCPGGYYLRTRKKVNGDSLFSYSLEKEPCSAMSNYNSSSKTAHHELVFPNLSGRANSKSENPNGQGTLDQVCTPEEENGSTDSPSTSEYKYNEENAKKVEVKVKESARLPPELRQKMVALLSSKLKNGEIYSIDISESSSPYIRECTYDDLCTYDVLMSVIESIYSA